MARHPRELPLAIESLRISEGMNMEIARGDLARILHQASANHADYIFGDFIKARAQDAMGTPPTISPANRT
jgi:hypothetical protein